MLFQPTNIIPDVKSGIGLGTVDVTSGIRVSWQVNGDYPVMTAMGITIYMNDELSTQIYTTGKVVISPAFYGTNPLGELQYYNYTIDAATLSAAGISNGNEYKLLITQYYTGSGGAEESVTQSSASVFITRATPSFALTTTPTVVSSNAYTFNLSYSQAQGDTLDWVRYQIAQGSDTEDPIYDSGNIYGAAQFSCSFSSFRSGYNYSFRATGQTSSGILVTTGWKTFSVSYSVTPMSGAVTVGVEKNENGVYVDWSGLSTVSGQSAWLIFREQEGSGVIVKVAEADIEVTSVMDYGVASGQGPYDYLVVAVNASGTFLSTPAKSAEISPIFYRWTLLACMASPRQDGSYVVNAQYHFHYNLDSGGVSNNNSPKVLANFTANPTVQPAPQNYRSGVLNALIGTVSRGRYTDSLSTRKALMALSVAQNPLFLKSSKGDVMRVRLNGAVTAATSESTESLAQTVSVPWIALDDAEQEAIFAVRE